MDWELYERYRSTLLLAGILFVSAFFLAFQKTSSVQHLRAFLVRFALPPQRYLTQLHNSDAPAVQDQGSAESAVPPLASSDVGVLGGEENRKLQVLTEENDRLREILSLKREKWPRAMVAHVAGRDPQRWFQELVLDKGKEDGLAIDDPVLAVVGGREALVGRVLEVSAHVSKVMLLQDSLSAVAATVTGDRGEDGVVEGTDEHQLLLKYLDRGTQVKIGDLVVTTGLGKAFPPGVPIGWVVNMEPDPRQMFMQATLHAAARSNELRAVLVLGASGTSDE